MSIKSLVTYCFESVCYSGIYAPHHPKIPPGIVFGLANGDMDKLPLVLYNPLKLHSTIYYTFVSGILVFGVSIFTNLFFAHHLTDDTNDVNMKTMELDYSKKYYDKYDVLCEKNLPNLHEDKKEDKKEDNVHSNRIIDFTGQYGNVIMQYNSHEEAFEYFADNKNIPFTYLETVSRKLGITFHCTHKIIDRRKNTTLEDKIENKKIHNTGSEKNKKPYKKKSDPRSISNIVNAKANKFIYIGKFSSFNPLQTIRYSEASPSKNNIRSKFSYKEYMESLKYT